MEKLQEALKRITLLQKTRSELITLKTLNTYTSTDIAARYGTTVGSYTISVNNSNFVQYLNLEIDAINAELKPLEERVRLISELL